jgi:hypothetical protein
MKVFVHILLAYILTSTAIAYAQNDPVFRSGVSLVPVDAEAVDQSGRVVSGLTKDEVRVLD